MTGQELYQNNMLHKIGNIMFFFFFLVVMLDPTNTVLHLKDITFILLTGYCLVCFKVDWTKLVSILLLFCAVAIPFIICLISMRKYDSDAVLANFKAISPAILLLWVGEFDLYKIARGPVIICCILMDALFSLIIIHPELEGPIWTWSITKNEPIMMSHRDFAGIVLLVMYLKSAVSFLLILAYYIYCLFSKKDRGIRKIFYLSIILFYFSFSGTRSTMLAPIFLFIIIAYITNKEKPIGKNIILPLTIIGVAIFVSILIFFASDTKEYSNAIKYGHISSYISLFEQHPIYLLFGMGPGTEFYSEGFNKIVLQTEWSYLELVRNFGIFSIVIIAVFAKPLVTFWKYKSDNLTHSVFWAYTAYLLIAGTNPLLLSSTGMAVLLIAYSYSCKIKKECSQSLP